MARYSRYGRRKNIPVFLRRGRGQFRRMSRKGVRRFGKAIYRSANKRYPTRNISYNKRPVNPKMYGRNTWVPGVSRTYGPPEKKYKDTTTIGTFAGSGWQNLSGATSLNLIPKGTSANDRIGRKIRMVQIAYDISVYNYDTVAAPYALDVILDKQCNGVDMNVTDIYQDPTNVHSHKNLNNSNRFKTLKSFKGVLSKADNMGAQKRFTGVINGNWLINYSEASPGS